MAHYNKGRRVRIVQGMFSGREATVLSRQKKGSLMIYKLKVDNYWFPFHVRGSYLRAVKYRRK